MVVLLLVVAYFSANVARPRLIRLDGSLIAVGVHWIEVCGCIPFAVLPPMKCFEHPNVKQSMKGRAEIFCEKGFQTVLMVLAMLALLMYPVACLGITTIAI